MYNGLCFLHGQFKYRLGLECLNKTTGSLAPAVAREASYTYEHDAVYHGATYYGMWLLGKPHGQWVETNLLLT